MTGYELSRDWFNFRFENPSKVRAVHTELYLYLVDQWNRLGQKKEIGLPTKFTMECLGIGSYNTFKATLADLVAWGFVFIIKDSSNQHSSKVVALSKNDKASDKALDKATTKALDKATDTIIEQGINTEQRTKNVGQPDEIGLVIEEINNLSRSAFKSTTKEPRKNIGSRLKEYGLENCLKVVRAMWGKWKNDEKMRDYYTPTTLFREANFEKYLNYANSNSSATQALPDDERWAWYKLQDLSKLEKTDYEWIYEYQHQTRFLMERETRFTDEEFMMKPDFYFTRKMAYDYAAK